MEHSPPSTSPGTDGRSRPLETLPEGGVGSSALGVPLFWKIVGINVLLMAAVAGLTAAALTGSGAERVSGTALAVLLLGMFAGVVALNGWVIHLALEPISDLTATAEKVMDGSLEARTPASVFADPELEHLRVLFNRMLDALEQAQERQKEASHQVILGQERTRELMADEIYASTAQTLAGVLVRLRVVLRHCQDELDRDQLEGLGGEIRAALEQIRGIARRLRPPELGELGVRAALEAHYRGLTQGEGPTVKFVGSPEEDRLSPEAVLALYRVVEEALTNAVHHAGASRVVVTFDPREDGLHTSVEDDGRGFTLDGTQIRAGLGLLTMMERAGYAQGKTYVDTLPGRGTRVDLHLPWSAEDDPAPGSAATEGLGAGSRSAAPVI